jgi:hypothetical protein
MKSVNTTEGVTSVNNKRGDFLIGSSDGSLSIKDLDLVVTETGTVISDINWRINSLEQTGSFLGSFRGFTSIPTNIGGYILTVSVNYFIHVVEDETHANKTTQYVVSVTVLIGDITYLFDLVLDSHAVSSVNAKTGHVVIGISDIAGLQTEIDNSHFNGNLVGDLTVSGVPSLSGSTNIGGDLNTGDNITAHKLRLGGGLIECSGAVPNMKITANSLRVEGRLILGENQTLWGSDDVTGLVNLMRITHSGIKDVIHLGFHDFSLQLYHAEWTGVSDKNITVMKSYVDANNSRVEKKEQLAYVSDLNNITGDLKVSQRTTTDALTVSTEAIINGRVLIADSLIIYKNLTVVGDIAGKIDASNITSGVIDQQRLPPS